MDDLDKPVIAAINGAAVGAGLGMSLMCDIRYMADTARVAEGYINVGIFPGDGDTFYLPRLIGTGRALEMFWTGDFWSSQECLEWGIVNRVFPADELMERTMAFADRLTTRSQAAIRAVKRATYASQHMNLRDSLGMINSFSALANSSPERRQAFESFMGSNPKWKA
jgi:enoyl-CoA hydratase/carnithine racemase